jgi:hypothetical protein
MRTEITVKHSPPSSKPCGFENDHGCKPQSMLEVHVEADRSIVTRLEESIKKVLLEAESTVST